MFARFWYLAGPLAATTLLVACTGSESEPPVAGTQALEQEKPNATRGARDVWRTRPERGRDGAAVDAVRAPNRDRHGPPDTERYIRELRSEGRLRELQPRLAVRTLDLAPDAIVADLGCGPGVFVFPLAAALPRGFVFAVDVEPAQLDALREGLLERGIDNVVPVLSSLATSHLPPGLCDLIFVADTYHHFDDRIAYFERLATRLAPRGRLAILEYKEGDLPVGPPAAHKLDAALRHQELRAAGYELATTFSTHQWHDFEIWGVAGRRPGRLKTGGLGRAAAGRSIDVETARSALQRNAAVEGIIPDDPGCAVDGEAAERRDHVTRPGDPCVSGCIVLVHLAEIDPARSLHEGDRIGGPAEIEGVEPVEQVQRSRQVDRYQHLECVAGLKQVVLGGPPGAILVVGEPTVVPCGRVVLGVDRRLHVDDVHGLQAHGAIGLERYVG